MASPAEPTRVPISPTGSNAVPVSPTRCQRGFTLIEVLVGLTITAAVLGAFFPLISRASLSASKAESRMEALLRADAWLLLAADGEARVAREQSGNWPDDLRGSLTVTPDEAGQGYQTLKYILVVTRDGRPVTRLDTLRLVRTEPPR